MLKTIVTSILVAGIGLSSAQASDHYRPSKSPYSYQKQERRQGVDYAKVVHVEPITRTLSHRIPEETCWNERVRYSDNRHQSATPAIIGGIIGATIGHSLGNDKYKTNRTIKTVALGALGASIGHDIGNKQHDRDYYGQEQRCEVSYHTRYEEQIVGYNVRYRYRGETYHTRMDYHPGKRIPVQVNVRPIL